MDIEDSDDTKDVKDKKMYWAKIWFSILDEPNIQKAHISDGNANCLSTWLVLVLRAKQCMDDKDGKKVGFIDDNAKFISMKVMLEVDEVQRQLDRFVSWGWLEIEDGGMFLPKFAGRQETPQAARTRKWRAKKSSASVTGDVDSDVTPDVHGDCKRIRGSEAQRSKEENIKNPLNPPDGGLVLSSSYDGPGTQGDKKKGKSKTDKADRASLLADGFGTLDTKRETVPLLKRQRKLGLKDDSVLRAYNLWAKGYGVETLDSLPDHKGFHGASFKGMLINALESSGATIGRKFTPNDIKQVFDKVLAGKTWHKEFESTRGTDVTTWTYLLRPEKLDNAVDSVAKIGVSSGCGNNFAKQQLDAAQEKGLRDMRAAREEDARIMAEVGRA